MGPHGGVASGAGDVGWLACGVSRVDDDWVTGASIERARMSRWVSPTVPPWLDGGMCAIGAGIAIGQIRFSENCCAGRRNFSSLKSGEVAFARGVGNGLRGHYSRGCRVISGAPVISPKVPRVIGAECEKPAHELAVAIAELAVPVDVEADAGRVEPGQPRVEQRAHERMGRDVARRSRAEDDEVECAGLARAAAVRNCGRPGLAYRGLSRCRPGRPVSITIRRASIAAWSDAVDLGCDAKTMDVPEHQQAPQDNAAARAVQALLQIRCRSKRSASTAGCQPTRFLVACDPVAQHPDEGTRRARRCFITEEIGDVREHAVRLGEQPAPGNRRDRGRDARVQAGSPRHRPIVRPVPTSSTDASAAIGAKAWGAQGFAISAGSASAAAEILHGSAGGACPMHNAMCVGGEYGSIVEHDFVAGAGRTGPPSRSRADA